MEVKNRAELNSRFLKLDQALEDAFKATDRQMMVAREDAEEALAKASDAWRKADEARTRATDAWSQSVEVERRLDEHLMSCTSQPQTRVPHLVVQTDEEILERAAKTGWDALDASAQERLVEQVLARIDLERLASSVAAKMGVSSLKEDAKQQGTRLTKLEREFTSEHGAVSKLQAEMATWDARRNTTSSERGGYVFTGPQDVQALVVLAGEGKLCTLCLDLVGMLTLAQDPYVTYKAGIQVHANAIKANFDSVVESQIKVSFEIPYPELIVKCVENAATASRGGAKWAPMFATAELFEDSFRDGSHRRVIKGIESAFELTQKAIDQEFPLSLGGESSRDARKIHTILSDQNRRAYRQCIGFIESLLPFYRTLKGGSLTSEEAWDRVFVFVMEFLTALREVRVIRANMSEEAAMIWGCFKATDLGEEFRSQKFIEHPKALAILALTSIEREGKSMELLEQRIAKQIAEANKNDKVTRLDTRIQTLENKFKNIVAKNPDLK